MKKTVFILAGLFLFLPALSNAQVGITAVPFLQIEPDSRAAGMGNTGVAIADNASALFWNPAGLAFQQDQGNQASITHSNWLANFEVNDLFYDYIVGKYYIEGIGTIGAHLTYLNLGEQAQTSEDGPTVISRFNSYELALGVSYGFEITKNFAAGTSMRLIYSSLASGVSGPGISAQKVNPGSSVGMDLSFLYRSDPFTIGQNKAEFSFGTNLSNIGPGIQYTDNAQKDPLPTLLRFGWALDFDLDEDGTNRIKIANDISKVMARKDTTSDVAAGPIESIFKSWDSFQHNTGSGGFETVSLLEQFMVGAGAEYWYNNTFALRGGYYYEDPNNGDRQYITFGAGIRYDLLGVDFSYIKTLEEEHPLANTLRFSLLLNF
ncbi:MAG: type IX secretion system outer membrane channel protein PorV [Balneolaceae bacterium]|nr:type IX secretion system outer membrane channel protein PorV [Balneolaceae bacterium]